MIWNYFPLPKLQKLVGEETIDTLDVLLPLVDDTSDTFHFMSDKQKLGILANSFVDEAHFRNKKNLEDILFYLPPEIFNALCRELSLEQNRASGPKLVAKISKSKSAFEVFARLLDIDERFWPKEQDILEPRFISAPPSYEKPIEFSVPFKRLKNYQHLIFEEAKEELFPANSRVILQMPTGSGKTRTAMEVICDFFLQEKSEATIIWLANSSELCEQAVQCFDETWKFIGNTEVAVHRCWGGLDDGIAQNLLKSRLNFVVCSLQTVWSRIQKGTFPGSRCSLLIVDEAHIALAETYKLSIEEIQRASNCRVLGLTATPGRSEEVATEALSGMFHGKLSRLKDPTGRIENAITFLRSIKVLSTVEYIEINSNLTINENQTKGDEYSDKLLKIIGTDPDRLQIVVGSLIPFLKEGKKVILFAPTKASSKFFASVFTYLGFAAAHVDGDTPALTRRTTIRDFNEHKIQLISNYGVLATGFDSPKIDLVCLARPTKSAVLYSQMIGRGLRGPAVGGTEHCTILEVKDNFVGMATETDLYNIFDDYWNE